MTRREFTASTLAILASSAGAAEPPSTHLGLLLYSYGRRASAEKDSKFSDPSRFIAFARSRGADAVQATLGIKTEAESATIRQTAEKLGVSVEGIVSPPKEEQADRERFAAELATARRCGAAIVRTVMLSGRRYEVFTREEEYTAFATRTAKVLQLAEPIAQAEKIVLAVENHKDFRTDEQVDLLKRFGSDWLGVCLDTGNNLALLEDPLASVRALAPWTRTVHLKDIGVEEAADGFRMAEVPLGKGVLDLKSIVAEVRKHQPKARFQLEMITRDPLSIPCLTEKYWATLARVPGKELARTLQFVKLHARKEPLPRITSLKLADQLEVEDQNVLDSMTFVRNNKLITETG